MQPHTLQKAITMVAGAPANSIYDVALQPRQKLMGASGPAALIKNFRIFSIALLAYTGGLLYVRGSIIAPQPQKMLL